MTEYKKLVALSELLRADVTKLCGLVSLVAQGEDCAKTNEGDSATLGASVDPEELFAISSQIQQSLSDGCPRMRKIVQKARETNPDRQIYNETMCGKIEEMFKFFCDSLEMLAPDFFASPEDAQARLAEGDKELIDRFGVVMDPGFECGELVEHSPVLQTVEKIQNRYILQRAKEEAWQSRVAKGLSDAVAFEAQSRALFTVEEKFARTALVEGKRADKMRIIRVLEERAAAKWSAELRRRAEEQSSFTKAGGELDLVGHIPAFLEKLVPDSEMRLRLVRHASRLVVALLRAPEDPNIRRLRTNNEHLVCDFGHPCLVRYSESSKEPCACASIVHAAEVLWSKMRYSVRYTTTPNRSIESLLLDERAKKLILPCGSSLFTHTYQPAGFEDYSERFLELAEPDAMIDSTEWISWHTSLQEVQEVLQELMYAKCR